MNEKFYISFDNNIEKKIVFLLFEQEETKDCWYLEERNYTVEWLKCKVVFREIPYYKISKKTYFKLRRLNEWDRHQINKYIYYIDLFKHWGVYEDLCEILI